MPILVQLGHVKTLLTEATLRVINSVLARLRVLAIYERSVDIFKENASYNPQVLRLRSINMWNSFGGIDINVGINRGGIGRHINCIMTTK